MRSSFPTELQQFAGNRDWRSSRGHSLLFGAQSRNGRIAERNRWGIPVEKWDVMDYPEPLVAALKKILSDARYEENVLRRQHLIALKPYSAAERLVKYTEFPAANDGRLPELQHEGRHFGYFELYNNIIVPVVVAATFGAYGFIRRILCFSC
ncbi:hypothetical protein L596_004425 [Steinernema carpocapsae]|uniref:glucuronosyltransferase n=1 Tax=Steinernema carpocapsae TaxID=34508 RepID=A0A4U8UVQ0_STECR|nr:hypothetical protein L596_004425 [Steinernema carpocapsae]